MSKLERPRKKHIVDPCMECKTKESGCVFICADYGDYYKDLAYNRAVDQCTAYYEGEIKEKDASIEQEKERSDFYWFVICSNGLASKAEKEKHRLTTIATRFENKLKEKDAEIERLKSEVSDLVKEVQYSFHQGTEEGYQEGISDGRNE